MGAPDDPREQERSLSEPLAEPTSTLTGGAGPAPQSPIPAASTPPDRAELPTVDPTFYEVAGEVARGGLGRILQARDRRLDRPVALKQLIQDTALGAHRFLREALVTARLQHPAIVPVYEAGRWPDGEPFYAMKLVNGRSLKEVIGEARGLNERLALLPNVIAVVDAIAYAHSQGVIHRDLKPSNVLIGPFGETVVIDWGLAKDLRATEEAQQGPVGAAPVWSEPLTLVGAVVGTPHYMPPEQARGEEVAERADVYALGALLYHVLAGAPPYRGADSSQVLAEVLTQPPASLEQLQPGLPEDLAAVVHKAMARDPAQRYPTAQELAEDLKRFQTGKLVQAHS
jgi:eukaryotic-like serine/threonine-protein kinase